MIGESFTYGALKGINLEGKNGFCPEDSIFRPEDFIFNVNDWLTPENELSMQKFSIGKHEIKKTSGRSKISFRSEVLLQPVAAKLLSGRSKTSDRIEILLQPVAISNCKETLLRPVEIRIMSLLFNYKKFCV
jgi:hypothetical protein